MTLAVLTLVTLLWAHVTDVDTCHRELEPLLTTRASIVKQGVAASGEDYVMEMLSPLGPRMFIHFPLLPPSQWKDPKQPEPFFEASSAWIDADLNGQPEDAWFFVRPELECQGAIHLRWNSEVKGMVLVEGGRDHV